MQAGPYEREPITEDDREMLLSIYETRRRFLFCVYIILFAIGVACSRRGVNTVGARSSRMHQLTQEEEHDNFLIWMFDLVFIETILMSTGVVLLFKRVLPYRKDLRQGMKEKVPYIITNKKYFPITDQYYIGLDDPKYMNREVDADTYAQCSEGGEFYIYRAVNSKYIFEESGRFTIL